MSFPLELDEYTMQQIENELHRRRVLRSAGLCTYCRRMIGVIPQCRFPDRHDGIEETSDAL